jgi:Fe2+ or Zn2+ uptake regulation protein
MHYLPPGAKSIAPPRSRRIPKLDESGFKEMLQNKYTSPHQREILAIVFEKVSGGDRSVSQDEIYNAVRSKSKHLEQASYSEIYYRLEQLFLLGFLEKIEVSGRYFYQLSSEYLKYARS